MPRAPWPVVSPSDVVLHDVRWHVYAHKGHTGTIGIVERGRSGFHAFDRRGQQLGGRHTTCAAATAAVIAAENTRRTALREAEQDE